MSLAELLEAGRKLDAATLDNDLLSLAADPRFAAVVGWLDRNRDTFVAAGSRQALADKPGALAHCMGSVHAIELLEAQLSNLISPMRVGGMRPPPPEEE